jgi:hypothetical protein
MNRGAEPARRRAKNAIPPPEQAAEDDRADVIEHHEEAGRAPQQIDASEPAPCRVGRRTGGERSRRRRRGADLGGGLVREHGRADRSHSRPEKSTSTEKRPIPERLLARRLVCLRRSIIVGRSARTMTDPLSGAIPARSLFRRPPRHGAASMHAAGVFGAAWLHTPGQRTSFARGRQTTTRGATIGRKSPTTRGTREGGSPLRSGAERRCSCPGPCLGSCPCFCARPPATVSASGRDRPIFRAPAPAPSRAPVFLGRAAEGTAERTHDDDLWTRQREW